MKLAIPTRNTRLNLRLPAQDNTLARTDEELISDWAGRPPELSTDRTQTNDPMDFILLVKNSGNMRHTHVKI
ncbi:hypothetical protein Pst134EA_019138 [Puccinia striiformis f. sp. tritici]|uniref:hypothetical protein n=1 Tax=Puccinia striiformis f. sp. tritici TaxID=168172 RepID=UPI002008CB5D|nr:hypothetical protein Pst134EA_019138 [Puccinia striiformis f. sp. tritici]KAH9458985.1 hypothetical protein Pst134EA_019138 [Puccinia striiformis f. sp. tritici]KAI9613810.1 hypothetical protein H4Q26_009660 [Puccinia striiformis f. sp. tritici PST-130]